MIKGSKPFLIITFLMSFGLAFYIANKAYPIYVSDVSFVKELEKNKTKELPLTDTNGAVLQQILGLEPNTVQLIYTLPHIIAYKVDTDSLTTALIEKYQMPSNEVHEFLKDSNQNLNLDYIFKDKNNTKVVTFKTNFSITK